MKFDDQYPPPTPPVDIGMKYNSPNPFRSITTLRFCLENYGYGSIWIEDISKNVIKILASNLLYYQYVDYCIQWNGKDNDNKEVRSGHYTAVVENDYEQYSREIFLLRDHSTTSYDEIDPLFSTNEHGHFIFYTDELPFDYTGMACDENGNLLGDFSISPYIDIWAFHQDYSPVHIDSLLVESGKNINVSLTFE